MQYRFKGFSRQGAKMLNQALVIAGEMGQTQAGTGHILLAIIRREATPAARFFGTKKGHAIACPILAPPVGLEPTTLRLTAACSTD